jgi:hypothetical protein
MTSSRGESEGCAFSVPSPRTSVPDWYRYLLDSVTEAVSLGRRRAIAAANTELVLTYWAVGNEILARQGRRGLPCRRASARSKPWGRSVEMLFVRLASHICQSLRREWRV